MAANELFSRKEVAQIFKVRPHTIFIWEKRKLIEPALKINGRPRYSIESIEQLAKVKQPIK